MLFTVIKKNSYQDSVSLMLLTKNLSSMEGVNQISVMMGTPANIDIFKNSGLYTDDLETAGPNDICIVINSEDESVVDKALDAIEEFLKNQATKSKGDRSVNARSWDSAIKKMPDANMALLSIAGEFVAEEANKALDRDLNVFIFSDNVTVEDERQLKEKACAKGLLVMGPDCGTGIMSGVPLAFANALKKGNIGIIGASGTGIQEVSTIISRQGKGMSQVIGIGGRDLSADIGGLTALSAIEVLESDPETEVVVFISKPPAEEVKNKVIARLSTMGKPVVAIFLGEQPSASTGNMQYAYTLEEAANLAVKAAEQFGASGAAEVADIAKNKIQRGIKGLYSGGTLASEAGMLIAKELALPISKEHPAGVILEHGAHLVIDLGDDAYTKGRPHPMIDPTARVDVMRQIIEKEDTAIVLLDFVIGYGGHENVSSVFAEEIMQIRAALDQQNRKVIFIGSVTGSDEDPINYETQVNTLKSAGVYILPSNAQAVYFALKVLSEMEHSATEEASKPAVKSKALETPKVINVGLRHFAPPIQEHGGEVVQFTWSPVAGGNQKLAKLVEELYKV